MFTKIQKKDVPHDKVKRLLLSGMLASGCFSAVTKVTNYFAAFEKR